MEWENWCIQCSCDFDVLLPVGLRCRPRLRLLTPLLLVDVAEHALALRHDERPIVPCIRLPVHVQLQVLIRVDVLQARGVRGHTTV